MNPLEPGRSLGGRYTISAPIASGGMGDVWAATDDVLGRDVAVKVLRGGGGSTGGDGDPSFLARFRDEARASASLHHPGIATVFDYGEDDGLPYLVMELVPGRPLSDLIRETGGLPPERVRSLLDQAAVALSVAHGAGVVHRDIKPGNIMVTPDGQAKLTDFGISRTGDGAGHTLTGEVLGTPDYLSPEQALGRAATSASDLYALGVVGHEMLTGTKPFDRGTPVATALAQVNHPAPALPDTVPSDLREVIGACLAKEPDDRPRDARAVSEALRGAVPSLLSSHRAQHRPPGMPLTAGPERDVTRALTGAVPARDESRPAMGATSRRRAAWLAVPAAAALAWGAFALGGTLSTDRATATPAPSVPATSVAPRVSTAPSSAPTSRPTTAPAAAKVVSGAVAGTTTTPKTPTTQAPTTKTPTPKTPTPKTPTTQATKATKGKAATTKATKPTKGKKDSRPGKPKGKST